MCSEVWGRRNGHMDSSLMEQQRQAEGRGRQKRGEMGRRGVFRLFEDFARGLAIDDASDEDQCRKARELLGYDRDYPYDTEVRDRFHDKACGIDHTAVDHMIKPLAKPPSFTEIEFEAPE
jgi:hypothetical protein